ncbi:protein kinase [Colletotrichum truncatum]|uniref:Protein kinase n=2 Tax=Colletotrichum truncatum TaxID=5467 RepID=A0ACC3Z7T3_COLTU|nr:protein kinase [Colletotrichum truncatum]KAF6782541.1 protein kinase [Colletotrichum truncatum]
MSGLEISGAVFAVVGIAGAFKGAVDSALLIESFFDIEKSGCRGLALSYHVEKIRLQLWGELCHADDNGTPILQSQPAYLKEVIVRILGEIRNVNEQAKQVVDKHSLHLPPLPDLTLDDNMQVENALPRALGKATMRPSARFRWTIKGKGEFEQIVAKLRQLVTDLHALSLHPGNSDLLSRALPPRVMATIQDADQLALIDNINLPNHRALALTARAKTLISRNSEINLNGSATIIRTEKLSAKGHFLHQGDSIRSVWIEWNILDDEPDYHKYARMISNLGFFLERVGDPALRLPPCYGLFDDQSYLVEHGKRRLGYVFGLPTAEHDAPATLGRNCYQADLERHPPRTLASLIRDKSFPVPLLGHRFQLAYALAVAFSQFHAAGWLHKGLHSGNIVFFQYETPDTQSVPVDITKPFVTGFQYTRPHTATSQAYSPLDDKDLQCYYHPDVAKSGFSRRRDLYGLGVILCEIGRWTLVNESAPPIRNSSTTSSRSKNRPKFWSSTEWRDFMTKKVAVDLGWRMGDRYRDVAQALLRDSLPDDKTCEEMLWVQQFREKVVQPLSMCSA